MKLIDFSNIGLGMELSPSFSKHTQEGLTERLSAMLKGLTNNAGGVVILEGCVMTITVGGTQYDQTAGIVFYNGEILSVDAFSGLHAVNIPVFQAPANTFTQQAWYGDGVKRDTLYTRKMPMVMAVAGSGVADYSAAVRIENIKANKSQSAWTNLALLNGWANFIGSAKYRVDSFGKIHLSFHLDAAAASSAIFANTPAAIQPASDLKIPAVIENTNAWAVCVVTAANMQIIGYNIANRYGVHGQSYWLDENS
jgi:hypothetical protein